MHPTDNQPPVYVAHNIADVVSMTPQLFGFMPNESIIGIATYGERRRFGFRLRINIVTEPEQITATAGVIAHHMKTQGADNVILIGVGCGASGEAAEHIIEATTKALDVPLIFSAWLDTETWQIYDLGAPFAEPVPFISDHPAVLQAMQELGQSILASREEMVAQYKREEIPTLGLGAEPTPDEAVAVMAGLLMDDGRTADSAEADVIARASRDTDARDALWDLINRTTAPRATAILLPIARAAHDVAAPGLYSLLAFAEWQTGDGARAVAACDQAKAVDPDYSMVQLIESVVVAGIDPAKWGNA